MLVHWRVSTCCWSLHSLVRVLWGLQGASYVRVCMWEELTLLNWESWTRYTVERVGIAHRSALWCKPTMTLMFTHHKHIMTHHSSLLLRSCIVSGYIVTQLWFLCSLLVPMGQTCPHYKASWINLYSCTLRAIIQWGANTCNLQNSVGKSKTDTWEISKLDRSQEHGISTMLPLHGDSLELQQPIGRLTKELKIHFDSSIQVC